MKYVLITAARNEESFIKKTLDSVVTQTVLPERWIIVDDGSTDRTAEIVEGYVGRAPMDSTAPPSAAARPQFCRKGPGDQGRLDQVDRFDLT